MRILKRHSLLKPANNYVIDSPQPSNISYWWNIGSLLGLSLGIQIITGVTLAMHYNPNVLEAFNSVEHIMRDVNNGWLVRYLHSNTASAFFFLVYLHIGRGLYYGSYRAPRTLTWTLGTIIFILMMATAFLGYKHSPKWFKNKNIFNKTTTRNYSTSFLKHNNVSEQTEKFLLEKNLNPVYIYENLKEQSVKEIIRNNLNNLAGIYLILNNKTYDFYIGSASTGKFYTRFYRHLINLSGSKVVKLAVRKYGLENFSFIILEIFPEVVTINNNKKLLDLEDFYLKSLLPNYNILTEAGSSFGYKHTELDRIKMKSVYSEERRKQISELNKAKKLSRDNIDKTSTTDIVKSNIKTKSKAIVLYNLNNRTVFAEYNSITEASKSIRCNVKTIGRALNSDSKMLLKRWTVEYK